VNDIILSTNTLPEPLFALVGAEKVRVSKTGGVVTMTPIRGNIDYIDELYGSCAGDGLTVDKFLEWTREDKEHEV